MIDILTYLSRQKLLNIVIGFLFFLLVTLPHEFVGVSISRLFKGMHRNTYDMTILLISVFILVIFLYSLFKNLKKLKFPQYPIGFFAFCLILMTLSLHTIIIVNIEIIHYIQYALMAMLLFPLFKNFFATLVLVLFLGAIDEAYQYYFLSPERTNYYDFNDVILNLLGAAMGLIYIRCHKGIDSLLNETGKADHRRIWSAYAFVLITMTLVIYFKDSVQSLMNTFGLNLDWANYGAILIRKLSIGFWTELPANRLTEKIVYHIVQPIEGVVIVSLLLFIFSFLYRKAE